jgi:gamma-glutamyltranspeptidase/glutathione hydrolase
MVFAMAVSSLAAAERTQGRSMVLSRHGVVATEHPLASQAGVAILNQGGTAIDAAVAANATLGVVAPMMCGIGGDLFAIVYEAKTGKLHGLNASGWAPEQLTISFLRGQGLTNMPQGGIHTVTVPGAVDGWEKLHARFGRLKLSAVLAPAVRYAEEGFPVTELVAGYWAGSQNLLRQDEFAARTFLPQNRPPALGEVFRNPDLGWAYKQIARRGRQAFYVGPVAQRILACSARHGGVLTLSDLRDYSSQWVEPISTTYRGWTVYEIPPNGQGIAALVMLNLLETLPLASYGHNSVEALHAIIESKKLAYADLLRFVADPKFSRVPVAGILSKDYARARAQLIDPSRANNQAMAGQPPDAGPDTTYLCVVDQDGNMVSLIQSNYYGFGCGIVPEGTGFALQNRGALFTLDPAHPNALAGHKRPLHTIIPGFMAKDRLRLAFGIMGGWNQAQAHAQFVANVAQFRLNIQEALEAPRVTKMSFAGTDVQVESRVPARVRAELERRGHQIQVARAFAQAVGGGQAVLRDFSTGVNYGASDPRKDGAAIPQSVPLRAK